MAVEYQTCTLEQLAAVETKARRPKVQVTGTPLWVEFGRQSALMLADNGKTLLCRFPDFDSRYSEKAPGPAARAILHAAIRQNAVGETNKVTVYGEHWMATQHSIDGTEIAGGVLDVEALHTNEYAFNLTTGYHRDELMKMVRAHMGEQRGGT